MRLDESGNLSSHLVEASELVHRLARMGEALKEHLVVAILLSSLPESYNPLVTALEGRPEEDLKLDYVKGKLLDEWRRKSEKREQKEENVLMTTVQYKDRRATVRQCYYCGQEGHFRWNCPILCKEKQDRMQRVDQAKSTIVPQLDEESGSNPRGVCFTTTTGTGSDILSNGRWIIDTGCTKHMTGQLGSFVHRIPWKEKISLADGRTMTTRGCGEGRIAARGLEGENIDIKLKKLLYVPGLSGSVLSVSRITDEGYSVVFGPRDCRILDGSTVLAVGERSGGLYYLKQ